MPDQALRILLGDTHPESRAVLEAICQEQAWRFTAVESSSQVLQILRDESDISLVMIDPTLAGPDQDVARAIKTSAHFGSVPVMFVLHEGVGAPTGIPVDGTIEIDHAGPARVLAAMREAISGAVSTGPENARPVEEGPRVATTPAAAAAVAPTSLGTVASARILVADTVATTRTVLEPLCKRNGWELIAIESGFQVLRVVRDTDIDLVLINPHLLAAGVSGVDIARTIKAAAQFRNVPVLFILHQGKAAPAGAKVDGAVEVDTWPAERLVSALSAAIGRAGAGVDTEARGAASSSEPTAALPVGLYGAVPSAPLPSARQLAQLREDLLAEMRRTVEAAVKAFAQTEGRAIAEEAIRRSAASEGRTVVEQTVAALTREVLPPLAERLVQQQLEQLPSPTAKVDQLLPQIQEQILQEARSRVEQSVAALTREVVPPLAERLVQQQLERLPSPAAKVDQLLPQIQEQILQEARRVADAVTRQQIEALGATIRQHIAAYTDDAVRAVAREIVPTVAERLISDEIARLRNQYRLD